jgi:hypothetical protein
MPRKSGTFRSGRLEGDKYGVYRKALETSNPPRAQRKLAGSVVVRDRAICHICGQPGADTDHHLMAKRDGGADHPISAPSIAAATTPPIAAWEGAIDSL